MKGKYSEMIPKIPEQEPNYEIFEIINLDYILYNNKFFDEDLA
jgi:hypothetical protein